jgi:hypothetical protein
MPRSGGIHRCRSGHPFDLLAEQANPDKDIDHADGIVLADPVFQAFRKERALPAIRALNKAII